MIIQICVGSSCHLKGSNQVIEQLQSLIAQNNLSEKVELQGTFCLGNCQEGVCVSVDGTIHSVTPQTAGEFFANEILAKA